MDEKELSGLMKCWLDKWHRTDEGGHYLISQPNGEWLETRTHYAYSFTKALLDFDISVLYHLRQELLEVLGDNKEDLNGVFLR